MTRIRLMTYNVHRCVGLDRRHSPERIAHVIVGADPDIVALQELDVSRPRTRHVDQPRQLADLLSMEFLFHPVVRVAYEQSGTAVLSRLPIQQVRSGPLPTLVGRTRENRGALWVSIRAGSTTLQVINTHLGLDRRERRLQAAELLGEHWLAHPSCSEPRVLCGDLNMTLRGAITCFDGVCVRARWREVGPPPRTWPSFLPVVALDHIFFSPGVELESVHAVRGFRARVASDHLPVMATFRV
jgi:endonuclease/exonuclease/phosphatase family metal-dependent hydrolase